MDALNNPLVTYALLVGIGAILTWIGKHIRAGRLRDAVKLAAGTAAGLAYAVQAEAVQKGLPVPSQAEAVSDGVDYINRRVPGALAFFAIPPEDVKAMIRGELGKLLAADPSVTILPVVAKA
jgi:hypothetical protein